MSTPDGGADSEICLSVELVLITALEKVWKETKKPYTEYIIRDELFTSLVSSSPSCCFLSHFKGQSNGKRGV